MARSVGETTPTRKGEPGSFNQVIDGFGASDAWQCQFVGRDWPLEKRERIADLLFSRDMDARGNPKLHHASPTEPELVPRVIAGSC